MAFKKNLPERISGTFCRPELKYSNGGKPYVSFTIAKPNPKGRPTPGQKPEYGTPIWFNCSFWGDEYYTPERIAQIPDKSCYMVVEVTTTQFDGTDGKPVQQKRVDGILNIKKKDQQAGGYQQQAGGHQQQATAPPAQTAQVTTPARAPEATAEKDWDDDIPF